MPDIARLRERVTAGMRDPVVWTEVLQVVKTVIAATVAWILATHVFGLPQAFLAPWSALMVVHSTVYRTFTRGAQQVLATVFGILLAWGTGSLLGLDPLALGLMVLAGLLLGYLPWQRAEATGAAATAVIVLTTGYSEGGLLLGRLLDTGIGVGVGLLVNVLVWPPLQDLTAARAIDAVDDEVGDLLVDIADGMCKDCDSEQIEAWTERTQDIDTDIDHAWSLVRQASESGRYNPRRHAGLVRQAGGLDGLLDQIEQSVSEVRSLLRTLDHSIADMNQWDDDFRERWLGLLRETGEAILDPDAERITGVRTRLAELSHEFSTEDLPSRYWTEYGSLILNLRNIVTSMDRVAGATPITPERMRGNDPSVNSG